LNADEVVQSSLRLLEFMPRVGELVQRFRERTLDEAESLALASHAVAVALRQPGGGSGGTRDAVAIAATGGWGEWSLEGHEQSPGADHPWWGVGLAAGSAWETAFGARPARHRLQGEREQAALGWGGTDAQRRVVSAGGQPRPDGMSCRLFERTFEILVLTHG